MAAIDRRLLQLPASHSLVGVFPGPGGLHRVSQQGDIFHHDIMRMDKDIAGSVMARAEHSARIYREGPGVAYVFDWGATPSSAILTRVFAMLPEDMRKKKVSIRDARKSEGGIAKL